MYEAEAGYKWSFSGWFAKVHLMVYDKILKSIVTLTGEAITPQLRNPREAPPVNIIML